MTPIRSEFIGSLPVLRGLVAAAAGRWDQPSALAEMTIGALAGHAARAVSTAERYLAAPPPPGGALLDAPGYFLALTDLTSPIDSVFHRSIRERAEQEGAAGAEDLLARLDQSIAALSRSLDAEPADRLVAVLDDLELRLDDYLVTRLVEVVVHSDDLAASLGLHDPEFSEEATGRVIDCLVAVAVRRHGRLAVVRALTRRERDVVAALRVL